MTRCEGSVAGVRSPPLGFMLSRKESAVLLTRIGVCQAVGWSENVTVALNEHDFVRRSGVMAQRRTSRLTKILNIFTPVHILQNAVIISKVGLRGNYGAHEWKQQSAWPVPLPWRLLCHPPSHYEGCCKQRYLNIHNGDANWAFLVASRLAQWVRYYANLSSEPPVFEPSKQHNQLVWFRVLATPRCGVLCLAPRKK